MENGVLTPKSRQKLQSYVVHCIVAETHGQSHISCSRLTMGFLRKLVAELQPVSDHYILLKKKNHTIVFSLIHVFVFPEVCVLDKQY